MKNVFEHARLYTGTTVLDDHSLVIEGKFIVDHFPSSRKYQREDSTIVDLTGKSVAPAFIDLQIYGASGRLLNNERTPELLAATHRHNLTGGTTRYNITLSTHSPGVMHEAIDLVAAALARKEHGLLGLHLEGPFINPVKRGAHLAEYIQVPDMRKIKEVYEQSKNSVTMITVAPEFLDREMLDYLQQTGWLLSAGHSDATYAQALEGFEGGIEACTHLYNAMSPLTSREPGLTGAAFNHNHVVSSIIADGIHCSFPSLAIAKKIMGDRLLLITDAVTASVNGPYAFYEGNGCFVNAQGTLSGSAISMLDAVKNCVKYAEIPVAEALRMASTYPARLAKRSELGTLKPGNFADLVILNEDLDLEGVYYEGEQVV